jgi:predicted phosphodiesterase
MCYNSTETSAITKSIEKIYTINIFYGGATMIYITGDTHGEQNRFIDIESKMTATAATASDENTVLIICGDFGYLFLDDLSERHFLDDLEARPYTICFVDGNHENFPAIYSYPTEEWNGGKVHRIRKNILHLMRGQVFTIEGKKFFTMGGAYSVDKAMRTEGYSWWKEELPTDGEYAEATANLKANGMKVDYIVTHTMPQSMILRNSCSPDTHDGELTGYLEWVYRNVEFSHWYCGHWHDNKDLADDFTLLWFGVRGIG